MNPADDAPRTSVLRPAPLHGRTPLGGFDSLRLCTFTTVAILAWVLSPPFAVVCMATLGLVGFMKARRAGLTRVHCHLRDGRLVVAYLVIAWLAGAWFTMTSLLDRIS